MKIFIGGFADNVIVDKTRSTTNHHLSKLKSFDLKNFKYKAVVSYTYKSTNL